MGSTGVRARSASVRALRRSASRSISTHARITLPAMTQDKASLEDTLAIMRDLRVRCDWDAVQTHDSLRPYLIEEAHEVDDALQRGDDRALKEELGDLLLQILFHSVLAEERGAFAMHDVAEGLVTKMRARHPHLYEGAEKIPWEQMKAK